MKTIIIIIISWLSIQSYFRPTDYRDSYIGNYTCKEIFRYVNSNYEFTQDTLNYTLAVSKSPTDSMLTLATREGNLTVKLVGSHFRHPAGKHCFGRFSGDSIYVVNIPSPAPTSYNYAGKK